MTLVRGSAVNEVVGNLPDRPDGVSDRVWQVFLEAYLSLCLRAANQPRQLDPVHAEALQRYITDRLDEAETTGGTEGWIGRRRGR